MMPVSLRKKLSFSVKGVPVPGVFDIGSVTADISGESIDKLADVITSSPAPGELFVWGGATWINQTLAEAGVAAAGHQHTESDITDLQPYLLSADLNSYLLKTGVASGAITPRTGTINFSGGVDGDVLTVQAGGGLALEAPAAGGGSSLLTAVLLSDVVNNNAVANTLQDVTGLFFPAVTGTYWFRFVICYSAAATTTGSRWTINGPANSLLAYVSSVGLTGSGVSGTAARTETNVSAYNSPSASNATSPTATANQGNIAIIEGHITPTASGNVQARFASEVANSAITAKAGSLVFYQKVL